jgi:hypothetical protein
MNVVRCKCGAQRTTAGLVDEKPLLSFVFAIFDGLELLANGWSLTNGEWRCVYCTRRRRLMRLVDTKTHENKPNRENV